VLHTAVALVEEMPAFDGVGLDTKAAFVQQAMVRGADSFTAQTSAAALPTALRSLEAPTHSSLASGRRSLRSSLLAARVPAVPRK
jgi:hypothetical protein